MCAACLKAIAQARPAARKKGIGYWGLAVAGVLIAWVIFFSAGEAIMTLAGRMEQSGWQNH
jgi:hypothetical protein